MKLSGEVWPLASDPILTEKAILFALCMKQKIKITFYQKQVEKNCFHLRV